MILPWLDQGKMIYEEAKELKLAKVKDPQQQYEFLFTISHIEDSWVTAKLTSIETDLYHVKATLDIPCLIGEYRHHQILAYIFSKNAN
ncbi:hypothetical protein HI914_03420 [Erysiphe necator]|uniref:Uncharacterized protein n=1 Tax=Uncinula necator TaxID=52586 RepID=A0A0B1P103_UNCNE|nr:hypothetical protein HI914_03420 [Erysiphe necator]KHJ30975.1 hypothetical protein EV44_g3341 [Erysiphe necator]